ncbi:methyltransferase domain-containing protein [Crossiella sp. SN42]|uniref:class I SAM-dependent methyltransferase n=1 Tax=Crossiella sp. SN42 TaxID=2944808 RepID=UPI00207CDA0A|nr:class I SAM-dependent methyltransferase [Crossiella sp. SN42]MCO1574572.1 methyltransferase domain-containing protein [Crossiella sp. SN42]
MADTRQNNFRAAFDAAGADFTALGRHLWDPIGAAMVAVAAPAPGERVLDACCGTGASAIPAARAVGPEGLVDAIDVSGPLLAELGRLATGLPQLHPHQADVTTWATADYDVVQCALGIFFFPDMTAGTDHLISRARPGGRVAFTIWRGDAMAAAGRHLGRAIAGATNTEPPAPRPPHLIDRVNQADSFAAWLTERGLREVEVTTHEKHLTMTPEVAWLVILGSGFRGALGKLSPELVEDVRERYLASLRAEGVTELDATTLIGSGRR